MGTNAENKMEEKAKRKQGISKSYTLKAIKGNIEKLRETELISKEEETIMRKIAKKATEKYIKQEYGIQKQKK